MSTAGDEKYIKEVVLSTVEKCGACGRAYSFDNVTILGHEEELWFLMVVCDGCNIRGLIAALIKEHKRPQVITDLIEGESVKFAGKVTTDDVAAVRDFLNDFDGDFASLFGKRE
ncbi:MAG: hypothetical protein HYY30_13090 [Chloroflexi bacterium]|nr:hypothetical protein [Chloroflexota bacterium]